MNINIPAGMTEKEVLDTIHKVCNLVKMKYRVAIYDADDIYQEAFLECVRAMERYKSSFRLENFLMVNLHNRMINLRRNVSKKEINTINLELGDEPSYELEINELKQFEKLIDERFSVEMRADYIRLRDGVKLPKVRQKNLYAELRKLANEFRGE